MSSGNLSYSGRRQVRLSGPSLAAVLLLAIYVRASKGYAGRSD